MAESTDGPGVGGGGELKGERRRSAPVPVKGGGRRGDPPLTTRDCATWLNVGTQWVRDAIDVGVWAPGGLVKLQAETLTLNGRRIHRVHLDAFVSFLKAIGWRRLPGRRAFGPSEHAE